ncbi:MAG: c-type cytochrome [Bacteroidetes bacterium]|nr:c-type cytochrome [Bacteroidota bacterium]
MKNIIFNNTSGNSKSIVKYILTGVMLLFTMGVFAHSNVKEYNYNTISLFSNSLFLAMLFIVVLLLVIIVVLTDVLRNVAAASMKREKEKKSTTTIVSVAILTFFLVSNTSQAQDVFHAPLADAAYGGLSRTVFYFMSCIIVFELVVFLVLINAIRIFVKQEEVASASVAEKIAVPEVSLLEKFNASVSLEKEQDILMDHDYDGIKELDNDLPPWWKYGFYATIVFAFVYLVHYHVTSTGDLQLAEYNKSVTVANESKEAYQKLMSDNVTENNVKLITDKHELEEAGKLYKINCAACHGQLGEGGVGPNFTDAYWLHGGSVKDVFVSIKYGWPDKGMKSWQADLSPAKMSELASYIKTLVGTNPPNQKEKQGELYVEGGVVSDSLVADSTVILLPSIDSTKAVTK